MCSELGITTVGELAAVPLPRLESAFGEKDAQWLYAVARGVTGVQDLQEELLDWTDHVGPRAPASHAGCCVIFRAPHLIQPHIPAHCRRRRGAGAHAAQEPQLWQGDRACRASRVLLIISRSKQRSHLALRCSAQPDGRCAGSLVLPHRVTCNLLHRVTCRRSGGAAACGPWTPCTSGCWSWVSDLGRGNA